MMRSGRNTRSAGTGANARVITRTGTRLTTPVSKPKPCIVRLEKIPPKKSESEQVKKPLGSAKNRNVQIVKNTPDRKSINIQPKSVEKLKNKLPTASITPTPSSVMTGRARRTPKPNPKYQNDSLITSFKNKIGKSDEEDEEDDDDIIDENFFNSSESDEEYKIDGDDKVSSDEETKSIKSPPTRGQPKGKIQTANHPSLIQFSTSSSTSNSSTTPNKIRSNIRTAMAPGGTSSANTKTDTPDIKKTTLVVPRSRAEVANNLLRKRKMEFEKEREAQRKRLNMGLSDSSDTEKSPAPSKQIKTNNSRQYSGVTSTTPSSQQAQSNKLLSMTGNKINQQTTVTTTTTKSQSRSKTPELKQVTLNRQKLISLNGKNLNQKTTPSPSTVKIINKKPIDIDEIADPIGGGTPDDDDYETMPTFTIVNINDIIGKKGDVLIEKTTNDLSPKKSNDIISLSPPSRYNNNNNNNRRKTMHTTILSDKTDNKLNKSITATKRGQQQQTIGTKNPINNNVTKHLSKPSINLSTSSNVSQSQLSKGPPRILNTGLNKKSLPITSTSSSSLYNKNDDCNFDKLMKNNEKVKENLQQPSATTSSPPSSGNILSGIKRKLPSEKVIIQRQGNKIIKKITCFETWYVINIPEQINDKQQTLLQQKNILEISLIKIANSIKTINLPSNEWTCKVSLQKMNSIQLANAKSQNLEEFTGDVGDPTIKDNEKYKYHPVNVMFRRNAKIKNNRMPYDRAVIFKNGMFFTNIEGKNVKLIGAPQLIKSLQDIEILLQIVDDMTLVSQFVEPASIIP